ncbi:pyochelin biosynthetic protein PchC [Haloactinospora alba]|uniref:Pyochelin biosynthetic protein PchC n=1 Tax=Haloactinospora alba TaxID=405555 RepID=A0A543NN76_9ACTN|nr:alpha/beta fold hydrolase [Haloactinospora alba]TQN33273.1 pyochelin biosynthetic protein PchC [Haloactinospora alba]
MTAPQASDPLSRWIKKLHAPPGATTRLVCFPYAGGGASVYRRWIPYLPDTYELWSVQYPGREDRSGEELPRAMQELARSVAFALQWLKGKPYTLFGHSMGAIVSYETCREIDKLGITAPEYLVVSGSPPPDQAAASCRAGADQHSPPRIAKGDATEIETEANSLITATLEGDIELLADHTLEPGTRTVPIPVTVLHNDADPGADAKTVHGWHSFTDRRCRFTTLPGDHFACFTHPERTVREVTSDLAPLRQPEF